jgi:microcystin-dependent protein
MDAYIGEIRLFAGNFAPRNWAFCQGQLLPIAQNTALFSILGVTYGGNGQTNFALPDLRGRVPIGQFQGAGLSNRTIGQANGTEKITPDQLPSHSHTLQATTSATSGNPAGNLLGAAENAYAPAFDTPTAMAATAVGGGNSSPTERMLPHTGLSYIICLFGIFPSRN